MLDGAHAMFVQGARFLGARWLTIIGFLSRFEQRAFQKGNLLIENGSVPNKGDIVAGDVGQPKIIVRSMGPHSSICRGVPPMEDIPFAKLMCCREQQMLTR